MDGEIRTGAGAARESQAIPAKIMAPMQIGSAVVYVARTEGEIVAVEDDRIRPVAPLSPAQAFESAGEILRECVRVIGERIETLGDKARPDQVTVEFSLTFEVKGKASIVPVFVTAESTAQTGLKVTALWKRAGAAAE
jgi:Trypsin-co-occurring domain 1